MSGTPERVNPELHVVSQESPTKSLVSKKDGIFELGSTRRPLHRTMRTYVLQTAPSRAPSPGGLSKKSDGVSSHHDRTRT